jgi:hypothetical protein
MEKMNRLWEENSQQENFLSVEGIKGVKKLFHNKISKVIGLGAANILAFNASGCSEEFQVGDSTYQESDVVGPVPVLDLNDKKIAKQNSCNTVDFEYVSLPEEVSVPKNATNVQMLCVDIQQGCEDGVIQVLKFMRKGMVRHDAIEVYIADESGARRTEKQMGNSLNFKNIDKSLPANTVNRLCLYGHINNVESGENYGYAMLPPETSHITNKPNVEEKEGFDGVMVKIMDDEVGYVSVFADSTNSALVPDNKVLLSNVTVLNDGNNDDVDLSRISLKYGGSCDTRTIRNLELIDDRTGDVVASANHLEKEALVHFRLDSPFNINFGEEVSFTVIADHACEADDTVWLYLEEPGDFHVKNKNGFGVYAYGFGDASLNSQ